MKRAHPTPYTAGAGARENSDPGRLTTWMPLSMQVAMQRGGAPCLPIGLLIVIIGLCHQVYFLHYTKWNKK